MTEQIVVGVVVAAAVIFVVRKLYLATRGEKGTCRSCGDTCGCAIKDAVGARKDQS